MQMRGFRAPVFTGQAGPGFEGVGFGVEIEDGVPHTTLVIRQEDGTSLCARLDDEALDRMADVLAIVVEEGNAALLKVGNDR